MATFLVAGLTQEEVREGWLMRVLRCSTDLLHKEQLAVPQGRSLGVNFREEPVVIHALSQYQVQRFDEQYPGYFTLLFINAAAERLLKDAGIPLRELGRIGDEEVPDCPLLLRNWRFVPF
jgi:hypothetical protein